MSVETDEFASGVARATLELGLDAPKLSEKNIVAGIIIDNQCIVLSGANRDELFNQLLKTELGEIARTHGWSTP